MLKPNEGYYWQVRPLHITGNEEAVQELNSKGIHYHGSLVWKRRGWRDGESPGIGVYLGVAQLPTYYFGVKKQHVIMVGSTIFIMDGYNFGDCGKV